MKIDSDFQSISTKGVNDTVRKCDAGVEGTFSSLLRESNVNSSPHAGTAPVTMQAGPAMETPVFSAGQRDAIAAGEQALALLEHCGFMLSDSEFSSGTIEPVREALDTCTQDLVHARDVLDSQDPLRHALDEIGIMSVVASIKLERGDFSG